jgi:sugar O-acyltransferase (sialic acid O-acetyltransferase NeuD family)
MKPAIALGGAGGHARSCVDVIESAGRYDVFGCVTDDEDWREILKKCSNAIVAIGQIKTFEPRMRLFEMLVKLGFQLPTIVSRVAYVSPRAHIGRGTIVMHGAVVNAGVSIGDNCIINSRSLIEHDAVVGNHCHISTGTVLNGGVQVGDGSFIGSQSVVRESVVIERHSVIAMGSRVDGR